MFVVVSSGRNGLSVVAEEAVVAGAGSTGSVDATATGLAPSTCASIAIAKDRRIGRGTRRFYQRPRTISEGDQRFPY
jgi:hypothetical protein